MKRFIVLCVFVMAILVIGAPALMAGEGYREPDEDVVALVDAERQPSIEFSPDHRWRLVMQRGAMPSIEDVSRRMLRLAGMRVDPAANAGFRTNFYTGLSLETYGGGDRRVIPTPGRLRGVSWSHNSTHFYYELTTDLGTQLWVASTDPAVEPRLLTDRLNIVMASPRWMADGTTLLCGLVPEDRGEEPGPPAAPAGPNTRESRGDRSPLRTYQDLLQSPHDEAMFEHYAVSVPVMIDTLTGDIRPIAEPGLYSGFDPSPDGRLIRLDRIVRPYSYTHGWWQFPRQVDIVHADGALLTRFAEIPLAENVPIGGVPLGPRSIQWNLHEPATLVWVEALDRGDPDIEVPHRDRWLTQPAPFKEDPVEVIRVEHRASGLTFFEDPELLGVSDYDRDRRWTRTLLYRLNEPQREATILEDRAWRDSYGNPGSLVYAPAEGGRRFVMQDGPWVTRIGGGASPEGVHPFLDQQNLDTLETRRLWRGEGEQYESISDAWRDGDGLAFLTRHQTQVLPPNYRLRHTDGRAYATLTDYPDPQPQLRGISKQLVRYKRDDGVDLSATLYLPADHKEGERLPLLLWAYPREFNDTRTAGQVTSSEHQFLFISGTSPLHLVNRGYAVMTGVAMPVIGDPETMNDSFIDQVVASAEAAIDHAVEMGIADRGRVAVSGHSYGAFMTANLLAHSDLFRAGVARSGAYNRTLTPFGFQSERRPLWEARDTYIALSPFMHAEKIQEPLLLIHGEADNNSGTYPDQSRRLFAAIKGNGGTARLVMLPNESHGYRARESVLHVLAETIDWLDEHVKHAPPRKAIEGSVPDDLVPLEGGVKID